MSQTRWIVLMIALGAAVPISAQEAWRGLRFGMTERQVTDTLKGEQLTDPDPGAGSSSTTQIVRQIRPDYVMKSEKYSLLYDFQVVLHFERQSDRLDFVHLHLQRISSDSGANVPSDTADRAAIDELPTMLEGKYGAPTSQKGHCRVTAEDVVYGGQYATFDCEKNWRAEGRTVHYEFVYIPGNHEFGLWIEYRPQQSGL